MKHEDVAAEGRRQRRILREQPRLDLPCRRPRPSAKVDPLRRLEVGVGDVDRQHAEQRLGVADAVELDAPREDQIDFFQIRERSRLRDDRVFEHRQRRVDQPAVGSLPEDVAVERDVTAAIGAHPRDSAVVRHGPPKREQRLRNQDLHFCERLYRSLGDASMALARDVALSWEADRCGREYRVQSIECWALYVTG